MWKKGTLKIGFANFTILVLNQSPINTILWEPKIRAIRGPPVYVFWFDWKSNVSISLKVTFTKDAQEEIIEENDVSKDDTRNHEVMDRALNIIARRGTLFTAQENIEFTRTLFLSCSNMRFFL